MNTGLADAEFDLFAKSCTTSLAVGVDVRVGVLLGVDVLVGVGVLVPVAVRVGVLVPVAVLVGVGVLVAANVGVAVDVFVAVGVWVGVFVAVGVRVGGTWAIVVLNSHGGRAPGTVSTPSLCMVRAEFIVTFMPLGANLSRRGKRKWKL